MNERGKDTLKNHTKESDGGGSPGAAALLFFSAADGRKYFQQLLHDRRYAIVERYSGVEALATLGAVDWLNWLTLGVIRGFTQGFAILIAQKFETRG